MNPMHILDGFLDASPSLWMLRTLCLIAALLTGCWCLTRSLEHRIQAQLQGSRIELGEQLQDLERKITAILDELRRARALSQAAPGTCRPPRVDNGSPSELSGSSGTRIAVPASRRISSDGDATRTSKSLSSLKPNGPKDWPDPLVERRLSAQGKSAVAAMRNGGARRASARSREGLAAAEDAGPMLSRGGARGASVSGGVLPARQTDTETLALSTLAPRVKPLASRPEHSLQVMSSRPRGRLKPTASVPNDCVQVASKRLWPEGTLRQLERKTHGYPDFASTIAGREPDVFKRTPPSGRSREDSATSIIQNTGSPQLGQRWLPLLLHEDSWKSMRPEIIARTCSQPSSGRAPDDNLGFGGNRILLTPPTDAFAIFALSTLAPKVKTTKSVDSPPNTPPVQVTCRGLLTCGDSSYHGTLYPKGITRSRSTDDGMLTSSESSLLDLQW